MYIPKDSIKLAFSSKHPKLDKIHFNFSSIALLITIIIIIFNTNYILTVLKNCSKCNV